MHVDEERIQRLLDGELDPQAQRVVEDHLAACAACARLVADARRESCAVAAHLKALDSPLPALDARTIAALAASDRRRRGGPRVPRLRQAAAILLVFGLGGAAYAFPGSPVRAWVDGALVWVRSGARATDPESPRSDRGDLRRVAEPDSAGIALTPGPDLVIEFLNPEPGGRAQVSWAAGGDVVVRAIPNVASYTSDEGRLRIDNRGAEDRFDIRIPRSAPHVEILVAGKRVFLKRGARITTALIPDAAGVYEFPLSREQP
jgi:hypothetical protein